MGHLYVVWQVQGGEKWSAQENEEWEVDAREVAKTDEIISGWRFRQERRQFFSFSVYLSLFSTENIVTWIWLQNGVWWAHVRLCLVLKSLSDWRGVDERNKKLNATKKCWMPITEEYLRWTFAEVILQSGYSSQVCGWVNSHWTKTALFASVGHQCEKSNHCLLPDVTDGHIQVHSWMMKTRSWNEELFFLQFPISLWIREQAFVLKLIEKEKTDCLAHQSPTIW